MAGLSWRSKLRFHWNSYFLNAFELVPTIEGNGCKLSTEDGKKEEKLEYIGKDIYLAGTKGQSEGEAACQRKAD